MNIKSYKTHPISKLLGLSALAAAFLLGSLPLVAQDEDTVPGYPAPGAQQQANSAPPPPYATEQGPGADQNGAPPPPQNGAPPPPNGAPAPQNGRPAYPPPPPPQNGPRNLPRAGEP